MPCARGAQFKICCVIPRGSLDDGGPYREGRPLPGYSGTSLFERSAASAEVPSDAQTLLPHTLGPRQLTVPQAVLALDSELSWYALPAGISYKWGLEISGEQDLPRRRRKEKPHGTMGCNKFDNPPLL